jgi:hypothetical protein
MAKILGEKPNVSVSEGEEAPYKGNAPQRKDILWAHFGKTKVQ